MPGTETRRSATTTMSAVLAVIGAAIVARTIVAGGGPLSTGVLLGVLFLLAGVGRLWAARRDVG